jgi:dTDP-4-amino-4,6-dideoxygalactose transaminase
MVPFAKPDIRLEDLKAVNEVIASGWLTTGANCILLENKLKERMCVGHVMLTSSLTAAVAPLLSAIFGDCQPDDRPLRAVFPTWTFSSVPMEFVHAGFEVALVDVDPVTLMLPVRAYPWADVIVPTHLFGNQVDLFELKQLNPQATIIDDAAHLSPEERFDSDAVRASLYSFYATKPLCTGEGGAVSTNDAATAERFRQARLHGISKDVFGRYTDPNKAAQAYDIVRPGWKANMLDSCAAMGLSQLPRLEKQRLRRKEIVEAYALALTPIGVEMIQHQSGSSYHLAAVRLPSCVDRHQLQVRLADRGIITSVHFTPLHRFSYWSRKVFGHSPTQLRSMGAAAEIFPVAEQEAERILSLPLSSALTDEQVSQVISTVWDVMPEVGGYGKAKKAASARS